MMISLMKEIQLSKLACPVLKSKPNKWLCQP